MRTYLFKTHGDFIQSIRGGDIWIHSSFPKRDLKMLQNFHSDVHIKMKNLLRVNPDFKIGMLFKNGEVSEIFVCLTDESRFNASGRFGQIKEKVAVLYTPSARTKFGRMISRHKHGKAEVVPERAKKVYVWVGKNVFVPACDVAQQSASTAYAYTLGDDFDRAVLKDEYQTEGCITL